MPRSAIFCVVFIASCSIPVISTFDRTSLTYDEVMDRSYIRLNGNLCHASNFSPWDNRCHIDTLEIDLNKSNFVVMRVDSIYPDWLFLDKARAQIGYVLYIGQCMSYVIKWACAGFGGWYGAKLYRTYQTLPASNTSAPDDSDESRSNSAISNSKPSLSFVNSR